MHSFLYLSTMHGIWYVSYLIHSSADGHIDCLHVLAIVNSAAVTLGYIYTFSSVQFSRSVVSDSLRPHACQASLSITNFRSSCKLMSIQLVMPSSHLILCRPFFSCPQSLAASGSFPMSQLFARGGQSIGVSASASVLPMNIQDWSLLGWTGWISLQSSQESSPTPQFKSINSSGLSFLHSPTLTSIHDHWTNQTELCWQSNVSAFEYAI